MSIRQDFYADYRILRQILTKIGAKDHQGIIEKDGDIFRIYLSQTYETDDRFRITDDDYRDFWDPTLRCQCKRRSAIAARTAIQARRASG